MAGIDGGGGSAAAPPPELSPQEYIQQVRLSDSCSIFVAVVPCVLFSCLPSSGFTGIVYPWFWSGGDSTGP
ncbi:hypothetical protein ABZP36_015619 [Zizania latifolia]